MKKIIEKFESPLEIICLVFIFIISAYFFIVSFSFSDGDELFPRLTSGATLVCTISYFLRTVLDAGKEIKNSDSVNEKDSTFNSHVVISSVLFFAYFASVFLFGFLISSAVFAIVYPLFFRYRNVKGIVILFVVNTVIVLLFQKLVGLSLTKGVLIDLSHLFF